MKRESRLSSDEQQQSREAGTRHELEQQQVREFATPEELLRYDAAGTDVPPGIAERLRKSSENLPPPSRSWWQRLFKR